jgi:O-antigen ligase
MSSSVATILFVAFILWCFYREGQNAPRTSGGLWVATIWVVIIASKPLSYWFSGSGSDDSYLDGSPIDRNVYIVLMILGLSTLMRRSVDWRVVFAENCWLWLFYFYLAISAIWSDYTGLALKRWFKEVGNVIMILIIVTEANPNEAVRRVFVRSAYVLVPLSVLFIKWYSEIGRYYHAWSWVTCYRGVAGNKNSLGVLAMVSGLFLLWQLVDTKEWSRASKTLRRALPELLTLTMCIWLLVKADSATALVCFIVGSATLLGSRLEWVRCNLRFLACCAVGIALFMLAFTIMPELRSVIAGSLGRDVTLTGRTDIWNAVLNLNTNPLIGTGFASVWLTPDGAQLAEELKIPHAHNGYLETYLNSGLIGISLLLAIIISAAKNIGNQLSSGTAVAYLSTALFVSTLVYNYTEATFNNNNIVGFILFLLAISYQTGESLQTIGPGDAPDPSGLAGPNFCWAGRYASPPVVSGRKEW